MRINWWQVLLAVLWIIASTVVFVVDAVRKAVDFIRNLFRRDAQDD